MILIDASVIIAFYNVKDNLHSKGSELMKKIHMREFGLPLYSDYIFDECMGVIMRKVNLKAAVLIGVELMTSELMMLKVTKDVLDQGWQIFKSENPGKLSFTDCVNIACMKRRDIEYIATFDKEFHKVDGIKIVC